ncbi:hypothetical protein QYF61_012223 [Mycteria americana]|uniref:Uncharacterized protein n=1 Tax=Mycteria americana TaxID=33587 RepID=A0AAN7S809_MYCAM|nr:hypothetical protein QYF61_012223 [Mycteria americana]
MSQQCALAAKAKTILGCNRKTIASRSREANLRLRPLPAGQGKRTFASDHCQQVEGSEPSPLLSAGETHLERWVQFWALQCKRDMDRLEQV